MEQKQRLFIYDRREVIVLVLLGVMVAAFAFTLGVHLGKKVTARTFTSPTAEVQQLPTLKDSLPNRQELTEQGRNSQAAADAELTSSLHEEVQKTGIHLVTPRQVDLPSATVSKNAGATTLSAISPPSGPHSAAAADTGATPKKGQFTLQIGSFPSAEEAQVKMDDLRAQGLRPYVRAAHVPGMGRRFRLFIGGFPSKEDAENAGRKYLSQRMIDSYLVSRFE